MQHYKQVKARCLGFFGEVFTHSLAGIPAQLTEAIAAAESDRQRNRYLDARNAFEAAGGQLTRDFELALDAGLDAFLEQTTAEGGVQRAGQLRLVDKAQFEDDVATRAMASKVAAASADELWKLNRRLAVLRGGRKFPDEDSPCGPQALCRAMQQTYRGLDIDPMARLFVYRLFERDVLSRAAEFYRQLNEELAQRGILKNLGFDLVREARVAVGGGAASRPSVAVAPVPARRSPAPGVESGGGQLTGPGAAAPPAANDAGSAKGPGAGEPAERGDGSLIPLVTPELERRQARIVDAIRAVQRKRCESGQPRQRTAGGAVYGTVCCDGVTGQGDTFSQRDLAAAIDRLQPEIRLPAAAGEPAPGRVAEVEKKLLGELGREAADGRRQKITPVDADTIDLVGMLFDYMLDDPHLPDSLKSLLSHLHTPYLKVALLDPEFFATAEHPARRLLDLMASVGVRWLQDGEDDAKVYQRIRHVVERVIGEFKEDVQFFADLYGDFTCFVRLLEKRSQLSEQRCRETEKGLDKLNQAKVMAGRAVNLRLQGAALPALVRQLLMQSWVDYLVYICLRYGADSDSWREAVAVVDAVVETTRPRAVDAPAPADGELERLVDALARGLRSVGCDEQRQERFLSTLAEAQSDAGSGRAAPLQDPPEARRRSAISRQLESQRLSEGAALEGGALQFSGAERAIAEQLSKLEFGTWFEFRIDGSDRRQRLKLSWYSSISGNYMFVNAAGVKCAVKTLSNLVRGLNDGTVSIVDRDHRNLVERAFSGVLLRLKRH